MKTNYIDRTENKSATFVPILFKFKICLLKVGKSHVYISDSYNHKKRWSLENLMIDLFVATRV